MLLSGGFSMAADALEPVMQMLLADHVKYVVMHGESMRYRKALIRHCQLVNHLIPKNIRMETLSSPQCGQSKLGHAGAISATHAKQLLSIGSNAKE